MDKFVCTKKENDRICQNGDVLTAGIFAGENLSEAEEMSGLADALYNGDTMVVDAEGVVHMGGGVASVTNGTKGSGG